VLSLHPWAGLAAGAAGLALGTAGTNFALSVSPRGKLPRPTMALSARGHRLAEVACGGTVVALAWAVIGTTLGLSAVTAMVGVCAFIGLMLVIVDVRNRRLPFAMTSVLFLSSGSTYLGEALVNGYWAGLIRALIGGAAIAAAFLLLALALPGQLGLGDVVLIGWAGFSLAWFGWQVAEVGLLAAFVGQAIVGVVLRLHKGPGSKSPWGPALVLGWLVGVVLALG
jgi:leader peptidase (prepilin peptidase) / N-methyltransferase